MPDTAAPPVGAILPTPAGPLAVVVSADGTVLASGFTDLDELARRRGLLSPQPPHGGSREVLEGLVQAVARYAAGDLAALDEVRVEQPGTPFQQRVWAELRRVPPGRPVTYAELSRRAGAPGAARAIGQVCARNLAAPFVPCHRVVPAGGGVGGYAYGADVKTRLLAFEEAGAGPGG
jgi:methylated-DNA-[protein]-cysteine S-methyltransferase